VTTVDKRVKIHFTLELGPKREKRYGSTLSITSALDGAGGQRHAPAAFTPRKVPIISYQYQYLKVTEFDSFAITVYYI
jgi:hypothetical protein